MFGNNNQQSNELYLPVPPAAAFLALQGAVKKRFSLKSADDFTLLCTFSSGASAFTWGEKFTAQVVPAEGGATLRVNGVGKVGGQIQQGSRTAKLIDQLFGDVTSALRPA
jgi:hypothetical protein